MDPVYYTIDEIIQEFESDPRLAEANEAAMKAMRASEAAWEAKLEAERAYQAAEDHWQGLINEVYAAAEAVAADHNLLISDTED